MDKYSKSQPKDKFNAKSFLPIEIIQLLEKNAFKVNFPGDIKIHLVVHVLHS